MRVCLFETEVETLEPLTLTRPPFDLWCGQTTLAAKQLRYFSASSTGVIVRAELAELYRLQHPGIPVNDLGWLGAEPTVLVNGSWLPPPAGAGVESGPELGLVGDEIAYAVVPPEHLKSCSLERLTDSLALWKRTLPSRPTGGLIINYPWQLVDQNAARLCLDFQRSHPTPAPAAVAIVGPAERVWIDPSARIDPMVVADTSGGPVVIDRHAVITAFTRLEGPCYIGPNTHVLGAKIRAGTTLGSCCRIGGEVEATIVQGYTNKYHDGFLGHSYVGEWVNLGAGTHNSDLRNDYGPVSVIHNGLPLDTGLSKVGCFIGDHTKTGLGTLINTGSNIGAFCNLLPAGPLAPKYMPSFTSWWNGSLREDADFPKLLATAGEVMRRRGCKLTDAHAALYRRIWNETGLERRRALREFEQRRLRRSA